jgi:hypothetical protein
MRNIFKKSRIAMEFYSGTKKNEILSFTDKWMELENLILSEVSQAQKAKATCSLCADYRPKTNAAILWDKGYTKGRPHMGGNRVKEGSKNLNLVDVLTLQE